MRRITVLAVCAALSSCAAPPTACPLPGQTRMLMIDVFFGRDIAGRSPLTDAEWAGFARTEITPRFPDGFTAIDAHGQWLNPQTNMIGAEPSKMVRIVAQEGAGTTAKIAAVAAAYRARFHQLAVGIVTAPVCAAF